MENRDTIKDSNDTRKQYEVLKDWEVNDTTLPYYGSHAPGSVVLVHEDVAAPLVGEGILKLVEGQEVAQEESKASEEADTEPASGEPAE